MKKILFCTPAPLTKSLGAAKVVVELAEEMQELGWECQLLSIKDLAAESGQSLSESLRHYLREHAAEFDVVDYDHNYLPFPRTEFAPQTLFVARSVLLAHHFDVIPIPGSQRLRSRAKRLICGDWERRASRARTQQAHKTVQAADLVNVCNEDDKAELMRCGVSGDKIIVIPFGISRSRRPLFDAISSEVPSKPVVAFVGTFDYRKGAREFSGIVQEIVAAVPEVGFRLLGTAGLFQTVAEVLAHFSSSLRQRIEVIPRYKPEELPALLSACSAGIFPSHVEGMPFGVLEMLAASVPVIAYNSPGPPMMLPPEYLVTRGDARAMGGKVISLLTDAAKLRNARIWAQQRSHNFDWVEIARTTENVYVRHIEVKEQRDERKAFYK